MGAAAGHLAGTPGRLEDRALGRGLDRFVESLEPLPGDRCLERIVDDAPFNGALARIGHADKGITPGAGRAFAVSVSGRGAFWIGAVIDTAFVCARHPWLDRMVAGLKSEHHDRHAAVCGAGVERLLRIEDAAVRRV